MKVMLSRRSFSTLYTDLPVPVSLDTHWPHQQPVDLIYIINVSVAMHSGDSKSSGTANIVSCPHEYFDTHTALLRTYCGLAAPVHAGTFILELGRQAVCPT